MHHLHGRDRRRRPPARRRVRRRPRRERADPKPAPRRDGRFRLQEWDHYARRHQPRRYPRPCAPKTRAFRPADRGRPSRPPREREDLESAHKRQAPGPRRGDRNSCQGDPWLHRSRPCQPRQRGRALGVTMSLPTEDRFMMSRGQLMAQLAMMLGGRAAERVVFDEITTGASNDLERVTQTARQMVTRFGMSEKLGPMALGHQQGQVFMGRDFNNQPDYSDEIAFQIDKEIRRIVDESYDTAEDVLVRNRELLDKLSAELIEYETVDANHLKRLIEEYAVDSISPNGAVPDSDGRYRGSYQD